MSFGRSEEEVNPGGLPQVGRVVKGNQPDSAATVHADIPRQFPGVPLSSLGLKMGENVIVEISYGLVFELGEDPRSDQTTSLVARR